MSGIAAGCLRSRRRRLTQADGDGAPDDPVNPPDVAGRCWGGCDTGHNTLIFKVSGVRFMV